MQYPFEHEIKIEGVCVGSIEGVARIVQRDKPGYPRWDIESIRAIGYVDGKRVLVVIDPHDPRYAAIALDLLNNDRADIDEAFAAYQRQGAVREIERNPT